MSYYGKIAAAETNAAADTLAMSLCMLALHMADTTYSPFAVT